MKKLARGLMFFGSFLLLNIVSYLVLSHNQEAGLVQEYYKGIEVLILGNIISSFIVLLILFVGLWLTNPSFTHKKVRFGLGIFCYAIAAIYSLLLGISWFIPNHYSIASSFIFIGGLAAFFALLSIDKVTSNKSFKFLRFIHEKPRKRGAP